MNGQDEMYPGKKRFFLVTVGTSIISNYDNEYKEGSLKGRSCSEIKLESLKTYNARPRRPFKSHDDALADHNRAHFTDYHTYWGFIEQWTSILNDREGISCSSAEMSSLLYAKNPDGTALQLRNEDEVLLVSTNTAEGHFCAHALKEKVLEKACLKFHDIGRPGKIVIESYIQGLGAAGAPGFAGNGLPTFINFIQKKIKEKRNEGFEVVLIPTGGYKALMPYMVISGIMEGVSNWYVYEDSTEVLELPPLPLHVDVQLWLQIESVLDLLNNRPFKSDNRVYKAFKKKLAGLLVASGDGAGRKLVSTGMDQVFREKAHEIAREPELILRAQNSPLLEFFGNDGVGNSLKDMFMGLARIGHLIWKGDRVPEMADHALKHHNDLFHLAERILLPLFYHWENGCRPNDKESCRRRQRDNFLDPYELYTLLCALFLHDCGHVVGKVEMHGVPQRRLLPTEVRDHHHVLGYLRLRDTKKHGETGLPIYKALSGQTLMDETAVKDLWNKYLVAPATLGLYHRKKMKIYNPVASSESETRDEKYPFFACYEDFLLPLQGHLEKSPLKVMDKDLPFGSMALLVCLLRIIDSLDEKASRTGGPNDIAFHLAQLETEAREEELRAHALEETLTGLSRMSRELNELRQSEQGKTSSVPESQDESKDLSDTVARLQTMVYQRIYDYIETEGKDSSSDYFNDIKAKACHQMKPEEFQKAFDALRENNPRYEHLFTEYVHSKLLVFFKRFQKDPYGEKAFIKDVELKSECRDGRSIEITINIKMLEDSESELICRYGRSIGQEDFPVLKKEDQELKMCDQAGRDAYRKYMLGKLKEEYVRKGKNGEIIDEVLKVLELNGIRLIYGEELSSE